MVTTSEDELGQIEEIEDFSRQVFCEKKSIPQSEFYHAGQSGIKARRILVVNTFDYHEELKLKYSEKVYHIYRTYDRDDDKTELYCEVRSGA